MEEHAVVRRLEQSRAQLRELLLPDPLTGRIEADVFPRSAVMRFMFDPGKRRMAMNTLATLASLTGRSGFAKLSMLSNLTQSVAAMLKSRRR
ncbi:MAG: hypothetical protein ABW278_00400 [Steroidobacteraceae bacterium]